MAISMATELSVDVLDHIFSFLVSHRETLVACSKDPVLSLLTERYLYYHVIVHIGKGTIEEIDSSHAFEPDFLSSLVSKNPHILNYVRKLQIRVKFNDQFSPFDQGNFMQPLNQFAKTLVMFPKLECIILANLPEQYKCHWQWSDTFRAALEDRLSLPTLTELHLVGSKDFPPSLLDNCKFIENLSLSGSFLRAEVQVSAQTLPQLRSLTFGLEDGVSSSLFDWITLHINQLKSVKCSVSNVDRVVLAELLGVCPPTLSKLDIEIQIMNFCREYSYPAGRIMRRGLSLKISPIPSKLQQLTIRTLVAFAEPYDIHEPPECCMSWLPAAAEVIKSFIPSLQHLVLDIDIRLSTVDDLTEIDFSPLAILGVASLSVPRIDLYVHTGVLSPDLAQDQLMIALEGVDGDVDDEDEDDGTIIGAIEKGVLVIHSEKKAPDG